MSYRVWIVVPTSLLAAAVLYAAAAEQKNDQNPGGPPPLVVDKSQPLLLDDPPEQEDDPFDVPQGPVADNEACFCCHDNYKTEFFAVAHAKVNVGCVKCHGDSFAHRDDEDNATPPDIMFPPEKIAGNCKDCHGEHDVPATEVIAMWQKRCPAKTDPAKIVCTDCHGQHRLKIRTVWWDKRTRKLVVRKENEQIKVAPDLTKRNPEETSGEGLEPKDRMQ